MIVYNEYDVAVYVERLHLKYERKKEYDGEWFPEMHITKIVDKVG